jgi:hypothetical protein
LFPATAWSLGTNAVPTAMVGVGTRFCSQNPFLPPSKSTKHKAVGAAQGQSVVHTSSPWRIRRTWKNNRTEGNPHTHPSRRPGPTPPAVPSDSNYGSYCRDHSERPHTGPFYAHPWPASPQVSSHRRLVSPAAHHRLLPEPSPPASAQADSYQPGGGPASHCLLPVCWHSVERGLAVGEAAKLGLLNGAGAPFEGVRAHASVCACCSYVRRVV